MNNFLLGLCTFCLILLCTAEPQPAEAALGQKWHRALELEDGGVDISTSPKNRNHSYLTIKTIASRAIGDDGLQTLVEKFMNKAKEVLKGNDPYSFGSAWYDSNSYGILLNASLSDLIISGIGTMNMTYLSVAEDDPNINAMMNLTFNNLILTGSYFLNLDPLTLVKLYGSGPLGATAPSMNLNITANLTQNIIAGNSLQISDLNITLGVPKSITFDITNLLKRPALSKFATQIINDLAPSVLNDDEQVQNLLAAYAKSATNSYMINHQITLAFVKEFMEKFIQ